MARRLALVLIVFLQATLGHAQSAAPADPVSGKASLGYLATSGNTESTNSNASFELTYDPPSPWQYSFRARAVGASSDQQTTAEAYGFGHKSQYSFSETNYLFASLDWQKDRFSGYREQTSEAVGYGKRLINRERHVLDVEGGIGAKQATLVTGEDRDQGILRGGLDYEFTISDTSNFTQTLVIESGSENTYTEAVSKLATNVVGNIALVLSYTVKYNSDVPPGSKNRDTFTAIALEYGF